jgi:hypothetical protein
MIVRPSTIAGRVASVDSRLVIVDGWVACFADDTFSLAERLAMVEMRSVKLDRRVVTMDGRVARMDGRFASVDLRGG